MSEERKRISIVDSAHNSEHDLDSMESDHIDERWLISYSDMMTLLFGLFVMLYAMAMETQGKPEKYFSDLAKDVAKESSAPAAASTASDNNSSANKSPVATAATTVEQLGKQLESAQNTLAIKTQELAKLMEKLAENSKSLDAAKKDQDQSKQTQADMQKEIDQLKQDKELLEKTHSKPDGEASRRKVLTQQITTLKAQIAQQTQEQAQIKELKAQLEKQVQELKEHQDEAIKAAGSASASEVEMMKKKLADKEAEVQKLISRIRLMVKENLDSFMIVLLKWDTEKHDLDLNVTDPSGHIYNFMKRSYKDNPAKFVIDSRSGPGVEMWQTPVMTPGEYLIDFSFYNNYGNEAPANVSGSIITKKGELQIPPFKMNFSSGKKRFKVKVSPEGQVTVE